MSDTESMAPSEHIIWFEDNVSWYHGLDPKQLKLDVASCPGWTVEDVINHLSFGLGLGYPAAMAQPPETDPELVFSEVAWPTNHLSGRAALDAFKDNMGECARRFRAAEPNQSCWTYGTAGKAAFWFRRAAIETTLHRMDVSEALGMDPRHLDDDRAADAIAETLAFALPLAASMTRVPDGQIVVESRCLEVPVSAGTGDRKATVGGEPNEVVSALWGRHRDRVNVTGDSEVAQQWFALIETAFAGR
jgi:uncharacterized protein (TIGR03083 family)